MYPQVKLDGRILPSGQAKITALQLEMLRSVSTSVTHNKSSDTSHIEDAGQSEASNLHYVSDASDASDLNSSPQASESILPNTIKTYRGKARKGRPGYRAARRRAGHPIGFTLPGSQSSDQVFHRQALPRARNENTHFMARTSHATLSTINTQPNPVLRSSQNGTPPRGRESFSPGKHGSKMQLNLEVPVPCDELHLPRTVVQRASITCWTPSAVDDATPTTGRSAGMASSGDGIARNTSPTPRTASDNAAQASPEAAPGQGHAAENSACKRKKRAVPPAVSGAVVNPCQGEEHAVSVASSVRQSPPDNGRRSKGKLRATRAATSGSEQRQTFCADASARVHGKRPVAMLHVGHVLVGSRVLLPSDSFTTRANSKDQPFVPATVTRCDTAREMLGRACCASDVNLLHVQCPQSDRRAQLQLTGLRDAAMGNSAHLRTEALVRCPVCNEVHRCSGTSSSAKIITTCFNQKDELDRYLESIPRPKYPQRVNPGRRSRAVDSAWTAEELLRRKLPDLIVTLATLYMTKR